MKVRMRVPMSGTRGGEDWPTVGAILECSDDEAYELMRMGIAGPTGTLDENETAPQVDEVTSRPVEAATEARHEEQATTPTTPTRKGTGAAGPPAGKGIQPGQR